MPEPVGAGNQCRPNPFRRIRSAHKHNHRQHVRDRAGSAPGPPRPHESCQSGDPPDPRIPQPPSTPFLQAGRLIRPSANRDSTRTGSATTVTISPSSTTARTPSVPAKTRRVPRAHQFLVTLTVHTNPINPATTPTTTSATSVKNGRAAVVIQRDGQHHFVIAANSPCRRSRRWRCPCALHACDSDKARATTTSETELCARWATFLHMYLE